MFKEIARMSDDVIKRLKCQCESLNFLSRSEYIRNLIEFDIVSKLIHEYKKEIL